MKDNHSQIHDVFFDLGNVLLPFDFGRAARKISVLTGRPEPEVTWQVATVVEKTGYEFGRSSTAEFHRIINQHCGLQMSLDELRAIWGDIFTENPEMVDLARALKGRKRRHILSNTNELHIEYVMENFPFFGDFEGYTYSYEEKVGKPDRRIYEIALRRANAVAENSLFIDDREENVLAAREVGMKAIHYHENRHQAMKEIRQCLHIDSSAG